jgi:nucleoporin POM152
VQYTSKVKEETAHFELNRIQPDVFNSSLLLLPGDLSSADPSFFDKQSDHDFSWAAPQQLSIKLNLTFEEASHQEYDLVRITDGAGNSADISHLNAQMFDIRNRPMAKFECSTTQAVDLLIGKSFVPLLLNTEGEGVLEIGYTFKPESSQKMHSKTVKLDGTSQFISAQAPGEYTLDSVRDAFCQGNIIHPSSCHVIQPPHPSVKVSAVPIPSQCHSESEIGIKFTAEFEGAVPYMLEYVVYKQQGRSKVEVDRRKEKVDRSRHVFSYLPRSSGEYIYEFVSLDDRRYTNLDPHVEMYTQVVHPQPDAYFDKRRRQSVDTCLGEDISANVELQGTGPFTLHWSVDGEKYSSQVDGYRYTVDLPPFTKPGQHAVSLLKIEDANECIKDLESRDFIVQVRSDRPTAYFYISNNKEGVIEIQQGNTANIPLRLSGQGPWDVTYKNIEKGDASIKTKRVNDPNAEIAVQDAGHYELLKVKDAICQGDVLPYIYEIKWMEKPTLSIEKGDVTILANGIHERRAVCEGINDSVDINFSGRAPFYCSYKQYRSANGKRDYQLVNTADMTSGLPKAHVPMLTSPSGRYRYVFDKLSDQQYTPPFALSGVQLEQTVHASPTVAFRNPHSRRERLVCVGDSLSSHDMDPIVLDLTGQAPFTITLTIRHASEKRGREIIVDEINTNRYTLKLDNELSLPGSYQLQLETVLDANGCMSQVKADDKSSLFIKALDIATINPIETCDDVCVGDTLDYTLSGMSPFTICKFSFLYIYTTHSCIHYFVY